MSFLRMKALLPTALLSALLIVPAFDLADAAGGVTKTTSHLNMRHGPGANYRRITTIPPSSQVSLHSCNGNWCLVTWRRHTGFVNGRYLVTRQTQFHSPVHGAPRG